MNVLKHIAVGLLALSLSLATSAFGASIERIQSKSPVLAKKLNAASPLPLGKDKEEGPDFTREVRPILSRNCFKCHGPDEAARKAKMRLDVSDSATKPAKSGAVPIVPGKPDQSELVKRIFSTDPDEIMPPPATKFELSASDKDILKRWIAAGGKYEQHWAFVVPKHASLPNVNQVSWPRNAIDRFVLARMESKGLAPSPRAEPHTLLRRVYLDLIGVPPSPEEVDAFLADKSPNAFEKQVDALLSSPRYGERWGRRWMDLARYADTNGYEKDRQRSIWHWRDWVIGALNADMPFDQFTIEQLAGDMLPDATLSQRIATGFHRNTMLNEEGGIDPLEFRFHAMTDRIATTGVTWLGLTLGCAQCHTHKFDPIPHREYYQMMAFLDNADEPDLDLPEAGWENRYKSNQAKAAQLLANLPSRFPLETNSWVTPKPTNVEAQSGESGRILEDNSILFAEKSPEKDSYTVAFESDATNVAMLRLDALTDPALPSSGPGRVAHGNFVLTEISINASPRSADAAAENSRSDIVVKIASAKADVEQTEFPVRNAFDGKPGTGWAVDAQGKKLNADHTATFTFESPVNFKGGAKYTVKLDHQFGKQHTLGRFRISLGSPIEDARPLELRRKEAMEKRFAAWLDKQQRATVKWNSLRPTEAKSNSPLLTAQPDDSVLASGDITKSDTYELTFRPGTEPITALRLEALPDDSLPKHGPGLTYYEGPKGDFFLGEFEAYVNGKKLKFDRATESYANNAMGANNRVSAALAIDGDAQTGWSTNGREGERHEAVFVLTEPLKNGEPLNIKLIFGRHYACSLGRFRISATSNSGGADARDFSESINELLALPPAKLSQDQLAKLRDQFLLGLPEFSDTRAEIMRLQRAPSFPTTMVMKERPRDNPRKTFVHKRGEFLQTLEPVEPGVLAGIGATGPAPHNRLEFARWLASDRNPLTARVTVNRQWQAFFGRGLVKTTEDFGFQGDPPSHPQLLDWLAIQFVKDGWSLKKLHKRIVMSKTYQQSSAATPALLAADPENILLARGPRSRIDAEMVRDSVLLESGMLSTKMGGPGVYPPQPDGVTEVAYGSPKWNTSQGEDRYRRSVYTFIKRTAPFAMFNTFDAPSGEACVARRDVSNTPMQALTVLNDVFFVDASRALGRAILNHGGSVDAQISYAFRKCLSRTPRAEELATLRQFFNAQRQRFAEKELDAQAVAGDGPGDVNDRAAWTALARALFNLDEAMTKS